MVIIIVSLFLFINIGRPILFKQRRSGFKGKAFYLYKFRTMKVNKNKKDITEYTNQLCF